MVFSSIPFLFFFLPAVGFLYLLAGRRRRNILLLAASLLFYAWGEGIYVVLMLLSICLNYSAGRALHAFAAPSLRRACLVAAVVLNLCILGFFKYANFVADNLNLLVSWVNLPELQLVPIHLPIGLSFFTLQALSYVIDVYSGKNPAQKNLINLGLYISLFPQLIAGPIVRYHSIAGELVERTVTTGDLAGGIQRFLFGMSKKVLLANPLAATADQIFGLSENELTAPLAWLGSICYTLQIYYDFSGYSDMAIGLGRMFGFHFQENFNYPYISRSIREFWRRWHISLSQWLRDYVYIPLGGSRRGRARTQANLILVFFLCGLWHGASWNFVVWGMYHGVFVLLEHTLPGRSEQRFWAPLQVLGCMLIVTVGFVIFRCETLPAAGHYLLVMLGLGGDLPATQPLVLFLTAKLKVELLVGIVLATPLYPLVCDVKNRLVERWSGSGAYVVDVAFNVTHLSIMMGLVYLACISLAAGVYNPFIYFRF